MPLERFQFAPAFARRIPDPNFHKEYRSERHVFIMPVGKIPVGISLDPNARSPNVRKRVYQQVEKSLLELDGTQPGTFHLKNKGITIIAKSVKQKGDNEYVVEMEPGIHGIVDGGHTYELITSNLTSDELPNDQFVTVEIRVGIPKEWITDIAGGLNTSVQVQAMSLDDLAGHFDWLKEELEQEPYFDAIAWSENDRGEYDARDIIGMMLLFNIELFPNNTDEHPVAGYEKKATALKLFEDKPESFLRIRPLLKDILQFHDIISQEASHLWNKQGGKAGHLSFVERRERGYLFTFSGKTDNQRLMTGALYPMLAAFRWYVEQDPQSFKLKWRGGFDSVCADWRSIGDQLMRATIQTNNELGRNPQSIGKSRNHWSNLHARVAKYDLMQSRQ